MWVVSNHLETLVPKPFEILAPPTTPIENSALIWVELSAYSFPARARGACSRDRSKMRVFHLGNLFCSLPDLFGYRVESPRFFSYRRRIKMFATLTVRRPNQDLTVEVRGEQITTVLDEDGNNTPLTEKEKVEVLARAWAGEDETGY
jgi:hypothetical protein